VSTGRSARHATDAGGVYTFPNLAPGAYEMTAEASGFQHRSANEYTMTIGAKLVVNWQCKRRREGSHRVALVARARHPPP